MIYQLAYRRYRLPFTRTLRTAHGPWHERAGFVVQVEDTAGRVGFGEVAPVPWFGTETLEEAAEALAKLGDTVDAAALERIDERQGCLRFALASALAEAGRIVPHPPDLPPARRGRDNAHHLLPPVRSHLAVAALLPAGKPMLAAADKALAEGYVAFKWKVGVLDAADERVLLDELLARLPGHAKLRLDANGAWTTRQAEKWLDCCAERPIEFVEQPCFAEALQGTARQSRINDILLGLAKDYPTSIALDESVTGLSSLRTWLERGWKGVVVVKPALAGAPEDVLALLGRHKADVVFSSALETAVGRQAALRMAFQFKGAQPRALGFGITPLFQDDRFDGLSAVPFVSTDEVEKMNPEAVWNALS
ncbi:MAG: o-succinylbenzoate synthase [Opitutaceae bacterium]|nr:o-succinylbenzoate synthase [Opitutaceae bacterium]